VKKFTKIENLILRFVKEQKFSDKVYNLKYNTYFILEVKVTIDKSCIVLKFK